MSERDRIRWHCRRGMLELDLLLERFNREHLSHLNAEQTTRFLELLALPDGDLLDVLMGRDAATSRGFDELLRRLRAPRPGQPIHV